MRQRASLSLSLAALAGCAGFSLASCGDGGKSAPTQNVLGPTAPKAVDVAAPKSSSDAPAAAGAVGGDCRETKACERRCESECAKEEGDRKAYYDAKRAAAGSSPFAVQIDRVFYTGACPAGPVPEKRKQTVGLKAIVEGSLTYNGDDVIYGAEFGGSAFFGFGKDSYAESPAAGREYYGGYYGRGREPSRVLRPVHGSDPWRKGESRLFHWESAPFSEAFCEAAPTEAGAYVELVTYGIRGGRSESSLGVFPLRYEEILGMALRQQVKIRTPKKGGGFEDETADAQYCKLDRMLLTRLTGSTEWLRRTAIAQPKLFDRGPAAVFPTEASSAAWKVSVTAISEAEEFGGYAPQGADQLLAVLEVKISNISGEGASLSKLSPRLEMEPGNWQKPIDKALGQIDLSSEVPAGGSLSGKLVFQRQRFQRPFRLEAKTPDGTTLYVDVLSYDLGPKRGR